MHLSIACVGRIRDKHLRAVADEYLKRLSRFGKIEEWEVPDLPEPEPLSNPLSLKVMAKEGEALLHKIRPGDYVIAMAIGGKSYDSPQFAQHLNALSAQGKERLVFVIGGSLGLSGQVLSRADENFSLSGMTFPHQLCRVILLEQLYRAFKINAHERYHK